MSVESPSTALVVTAGARRCAIPLSFVGETMRPLPVEPVGGAPAFVCGLSVIRGSPTLVIDLSLLLGSEGTARAATRFVTLRVGTRVLALRVETVIGVRALESVRLAELPPLIHHAAGDVLESIGTLDTELLVVLRAARLAPEHLWPEAARDSP